MARAEAKEKRDFRQDLTNEITRLIEEGVAPWQKPWHPDQASAFLRLPHNASTGRPYRGGNSIYLMSKAQSLGSEDPRWCTFKQAEAEGWHIKKGSKGTAVEYWQFDKEEKHRDPATGEEKRVRVKLEIPRVFYATVFHASQIEGMPELAPIERPDGWDAVGEAERILAGSGAQIFHDQTDRAFYSVTSDQVHLPPKGAFDQALDYYEVALHELAHWSGHSSRLNRDLSGEFGSESYAREELRAQMASLYLSAELGVPFNPERHAAYQSSWVAALKSDKNEIFRAARDAEIIADHIKDLARSKDREMAMPEQIAPSPTELREPGRLVVEMTLKQIEDGTLMRTLESESADGVARVRNAIAWIRQQSPKELETLKAKIDEAYEDLEQRYGQLKETEEQPVIGAFGPIFHSYKGNPEGAIAKLKALKSGEAIGALNHPAIGEIDLVWGEEGTSKSDGFGIAKLVKFHPEVLDNLQSIISAMEVTSRSENRVRLESADHRAAVRLTWDSEAKHWLLTAYRKLEDRTIEAGVASTTTDIADLTGVDDTARHTDASDFIVDRKLQEFYDKGASRQWLERDSGSNSLHDQAGSNVSGVIESAKSGFIEPIRRGNFEGAGRNEVQEAVAQAVEADPDKFIERFNALPQSFGGRFISADTFKETFEQYRESNEARNLFNTPVHNAAAVLASEQLRRVLQEPPKPGANTVVLLTGIPGAGKTSSVLENGSLNPRIHAVYEGQLAEPNVAIAKIQQVLEAGFKPVIVVVHPTPEKALDNTLLRFEEIGRGASINTMAKIQGGLPASLAAVHDEFGEAVELKVLDRRNFSVPQWVKSWQNLSLLESEGNYEHIKQRLEQHLESRSRQGLDADAYRQAAGLAPIVRERGRRIHEGHDGQHDTAIERRGTPQEDRRNAGLSQPKAHSSASPTPASQPLVRELDKVAAALDFISPDDRETWVRMAMAIENGLGADGFDIWDRWSQRAENYRPLAAKAVWKSAQGGQGISLGTLYWEAKQQGFNSAEWRTQDAPIRQDNSAERAAKLAAEAAQAEAKYQKSAAKAQVVFNQAQPANNTHPYLVRKGVNSPLFIDSLNPSAPREIWATDLKKALGYLPNTDEIPLAGRVLVFPVTNAKGISTLEFIDESGLKSAMAGGKKAGAWYAPREAYPSDPQVPTIVVEGVATAMSTHQGLNPPGQPIKAYVVAALSDTNLKNVARAMRELRPEAPIIVGADAISSPKSDPIQKAHDAAAEVDGRFCYPEFAADRLLNGKAPTDFNDLEAIFREDGKNPADFHAAMATIFAGAHRAISGEESWRTATQAPSPAPSVQPPQSQEIHMPDASASTPKTPYAAKPIGPQIFKTTDLPPELLNHIKERYGTRTTIATPKENGTYQGEIRDLKTHIIQEVSARSVVVHDKAQMGFKGIAEKANVDNRLDGWDLKVYYDGQKATAYPFDRQKEQFEIVVNSLKKSAREAGTAPSFSETLDGLSKTTWQRIVESRKRGAAPAAPSAPAQTPPKADEPAKKKR